MSCSSGIIVLQPEKHLSASCNSISCPEMPRYCLLRGEKKHSKR